METISQSNARKRALRSRKCEKRDNGSTLWGFQRISMRAKGRILRYIIKLYIKYVVVFYLCERTSLFGKNKLLLK